MLNGNLFSFRGEGIWGDSLLVIDLKWFILAAVGFLACYIFSLLCLRARMIQNFSKVQLNEINAMLSEILEVNFKSNSLANASQSILIVLKRFYGIDFISILLYNEKSDHFEIIASNVSSQHLKAIESYCTETYKTLGRSSAKVRTAEGGTLTYPSADERGVCFSYFTPLRYNQKLIGAILLENKSTNVMIQKKDRYDLYEKVFNSTALVLENVLYTENLIRLTSTDQLTGVYNRRFIDMTLAEQLSIHRNLGLSFSIAMFDIDHFKKFNDTYGHAFGDLVLTEVSNYVKRNLDENSWIARYGGEEFLIFFGRSQPEEVYQKVDELRQGLEKLELTDGKTTVSVTASFGVCSFPKHDGSVNDLIQIADNALYRSKHTGRNKVTIAD